jgi:hypothetical protein
MTLPISFSGSSVGMAPSSAFPKYGGAMTMYHVLLRHLSRTRFVFVDTFILRLQLEGSHHTIKTFTPRIRRREGQQTETLITEEAITVCNVLVE